MFENFGLTPPLKIGLFLTVFGLGCLTCLKAKQQKEPLWRNLGYLAGGLMIILGLVFSLMVIYRLFTVKYSLFRITVLMNIGLSLIIFCQGYFTCLKAKQQKKPLWRNVGYLAGGLMIVLGLVFSLMAIYHFLGLGSIARPAVLAESAKQSINHPELIKPASRKLKKVEHITMTPVAELGLFLIVFGLGCLTCLKAKQQKEPLWRNLGYLAGGLMIILGLVFSLKIIKDLPQGTMEPNPVITIETPPRVNGKMDKTDLPLTPLSKEQ